MSRYEMITVAELEVGDVFVFVMASRPHIVKLSSVVPSPINGEFRLNFSEGDRGFITYPGHHPIFRRVPDADDPRVLRRAILLMERSWLQGMGLRNTKHYIDKAIKELESEGNHDQA